MTTVITISSWLIFLAAACIACQNYRYLRCKQRRRQSLHFAIGLLSIYLASIYLMAAIDPTIYLIRSGLLTKAAILLQLWLLYKVTKADETDYRLEDRIGRRS